MTQDVYALATPEPTGAHDADVIGLVLDPEPWTREALCAEVDPDLFFPEGKGTDSTNAKKVCASCDVRAQCLEYALRTEQQHGIWGGVAIRERRKLIQGRAA